MIKCIYDECQWPECDKTCGLTPTGDYSLGSCPEEGLIYHLQEQIKELLKANDKLKQQFIAARSAVRHLNASLSVPSYDYAKFCQFNYNDCVYNPEYIRRNHPDWWVELGMPIDCPNCTEESCCYDDEDK